MARSIVCDGCNTAVDIPEKVGQVQKGDYCEKCVAVVQALYAKLDELHESVVAMFTDGREVLLSDFEKENPKFYVPDFKES